MPNIKNRKQVMVDLETLGLEEDAIVFSIGVVIYDGNWNELSAFSVNLDIEEQQNELNRKLDPDTKAWWSKQDVSIWNKCTKDSVYLVEGLTLLVNYLERELGDPKKAIYWGNSAIFDLLKINSLFNDLNFYRLAGVLPRNVPSNVLDFKIDEYYMRCYKSVRDVFRDYHGVKNSNSNVTHYPIDDARTQGYFMKEISKTNCKQNAKNLNTENKTSMQIGDTVNRVF